MTNPTLRAIGWNDFFEAQIADLDLHAAIIVRVSAHHSIEVEVAGETGEFRVQVQNAEAEG
ncbi:MAG: hypothetical protein KC983_10890, partial [Phycisphaerales bacterium]|nr:hypothetical protein [Phycisphaerales bacterium]